MQRMKRTMVFSGAAAVISMLSISMFLLLPIPGYAAVTMRDAQPAPAR